MKKAFTIIAVFGTVAVFAQNSETDIDVNIGGMGIDMNVNVRETYTETHTTTTTTTTSGGEDHYVMNGYNGAIGCPWPMDDNQFSDALSSVSSKSFDDDKVTVAKQITGSNCLTAEQVKRMMGELDFEDSKLEYAKFAYDKTFDIGNYYELNEYINGQ